MPSLHKAARALLLCLGALSLLAAAPVEGKAFTFCRGAGESLRLGCCCKASHGSRAAQPPHAEAQRDQATRADCLGVDCCEGKRVPHLAQASFGGEASRHDVAPATTLLRSFATLQQSAPLSLDADALGPWAAPTALLLARIGRLLL